MWKDERYDEQLAVVRGELAPTLVITNITYLHSIFKRWQTGNIWVYEDRFVYVGRDVPKRVDGTEIIDGTGRYAVPGYIEPHVHPFQLYNMETFANYAAKTGTTSFITDNLISVMHDEESTTFELIERMKALPYTIYWWSRFDSQTGLLNEAELFNREEAEKWLSRRDVLLAGELTSWPQLLQGDERLRAMMRVAVDHRVKIEGHLPGASEKTLAQMKLLHVAGDHEAMTLEDVKMRLQHGYGVTLRYSSIRPDLPIMLRGIVEEGWDVFDQLMMTTDGSTPTFYEDGVMNVCIDLAMKEGVRPVDAYQMASYNIARYYDIADEIGLIATGRKATLNLLSSIDNPTPTDVLSNGKWIVRDGEAIERDVQVDWSIVPDLDIQFELTDEMLTPMTNIGIELVNDVITKPYESTLDLSVDALSYEHDECFLTVISRDGSIRMSTVVKGLANRLDGAASSYSNTGDIVMIGKTKAGIRAAVEHIRRSKGSVVLVEGTEVVASIPMTIGGTLSALPIEEMIERERQFTREAERLGYTLGNIIFTFLFLQSIHLPYVRVTRQGLFDVLKRDVIVPSEK